MFFARFVVGLRTWASWLAGATKMDWWRFAAWNALGGIVWSIVIGLLAYYAGRGVETAISDVGVYALVAVAVVATAAAGTMSLRRRRRVPDAAADPSE